MAGRRWRFPKDGVSEWKQTHRLVSLFFLLYNYRSAHTIRTTCARVLQQTIWNHRTLEKNGMYKINHSVFSPEMFTSDSTALTQSHTFVINTLFMWLKLLEMYMFYQLTICISAKFCWFFLFLSFLVPLSLPSSLLPLLFLSNLAIWKNSPETD